MKNDLILQLVQMLINDEGNNSTAIEASNESLYDSVIGEYVIVRSRNEG